MPSALFLNVRGVVQGVGFRYFTQSVAQRLSLTGYVKNLPDGSVEAYAEGERPQLEQFLAEIERGPRSATVRHIDAHWKETSHKYKDFHITF